jgi:hypothetical protein
MMMALLRRLSRLIVLFIGAAFALGQLFAGEFIVWHAATRPVGVSASD